MKIAYILLVIAAFAVSSQVVMDLIAESGATASASQQAIDVTPNVVVEGESAKGKYQLDPTVAKQVEAILSGQEVTDPLTAATTTTNTATPGQASSDPVGIPASDDTTTEMVPIPDPLLVTSAGADPDATASDVAELRTAPDPIRQKSPLHPQMVTPGNFEYLGAIRPPLVQGRSSTFGYGGWAVTYREDGDPDGPDDGFPGSLFIGGHRQQQLVAEVTIPRPVISPEKNLDDLSVFEVLQDFGDITGGIRTHLTAGSSEPFEIGGMQVVDDGLHWTTYKYYNVEGRDYLSHALSSLDLKRPQPKGLWHLGPFQSGDARWHSYKHAGYICAVPDNIADRYLGGRNLMSGLQIVTGLQKSSQGPALFAYKIPERTPSPGASLDAVPLLWYPMGSPIDKHHHADSWQGAAWLTLGDKQTVIVVGRKAHGPVHYGEPRPGDCYEDKGYHGSSYEAQMLFYAPGDLLSAGRRPVANVRPWYRWDSTTPGGGIDRFMFQDCGREIGGLTYDRKRNLLYMVEVAAGLTSENEWEVLPVVHVMRLVN
ncbi:hypothetical protein [Fuerstiella marisgermanici]|uniref:Secreted protein n=1 Tax=Fuerstiella marisgermanici TaxID=1891926 RepID=A0A1P8WAY1_9PLAN|nr:hypothetical protein [Fuerstiella marisgermanici]APZ91193.1 hypothetical protein Fuma_00779 [Fuerstiella marisgermanici]